MTSATSLQKVKFLRDASPRFMIDLSMTLHAIVFAPADIAPRGYMYIVQRGIALYNGKVLTKGGTWGDDMILQSEALRLRATARAMNYLEVCVPAVTDVTDVTTTRAMNYLEVCVPP